MFLAFRGHRSRQILLGLPRPLPPLRVFISTRPPKTSRKYNLLDSIVPFPRVNRQIEVDSRVQRLEALKFILRRAIGREHGLPIRDDGFVSVRDLLHHHQFRSMDMVELYKLLEDDIKNTLELVFDPTMGECGWWIRYKPFEIKEFKLFRLNQTDSIPLAVYRTDPETFAQISRVGLRRTKEGYIQLAPYYSVSEYLRYPMQITTEVLVCIDVRRGMRQGIPFFHTKQKEILTPGNKMGYLPPSLIVEAKRLDVTCKVLWHADWERNQPSGINGAAHPEVKFDSPPPFSTGQTIQIVPAFSPPLPRNFTLDPRNFAIDPFVDETPKHQVVTTDEDLLAEARQIIVSGVDPERTP